MRRTLIIIQIVLDLLMLVMVLVYAITENQFSPFVMGLWVFIALLEHIKNAEEDW